jgi:fructose-bisphosphate aldolase class II
MAFATVRQLLDHAAENGYGIPFNVNNMEQTQAIMEAAAATDSPVIMQASAGARSYAGEVFLRALMGAAAETWPHIPVAVHLDHGSSPAACRSAIDAGFTSVMMDGSLLEDGKTPSTFEYNVETTRAVVEAAHAVGVSTEGELGVLGSLETGEAGEEDGVGAKGKLTREQMLTDSDQAAEFVTATGVDALAVAIGTSHGAYKFTKRPTGEVLAIDRIKEIHAKLPDTHLVMHGSSSVPQELQESIRHGVRKINIDTDIRLAMTGAIRRAMAADPSQFDPRGYLKEARAAARELCALRYEQFGAAGHASKIDVIPLEEMADLYAGGRLV